MIELIVVISIIGTLLLFSFPVFRDAVFFTDGSNEVGRLVRLMEDLKTRAIEGHVDYLLHLEAGADLIWVTHENMDETARQAAKDNGVSLAQTIRFTDVAYPGRESVPGGPEYVIRFRKEGFSDHALIHLTQSGDALTLKLGPFISGIQLVDGHISLEDCI